MPGCKPAEDEIVSFYQAPNCRGIDEARFLVMFSDLVALAQLFQIEPYKLSQRIVDEQNSIQS